jgi:hypothetical protein
MKLLRKGQGAFEYVLILAGVLLIVVLAIVILRGGLGGNARELALASCTNQIAKVGACYDTNGDWKADFLLPGGFAAYPGLYKCVEYQANADWADIPETCGPAPNPT